MDQRQGHQALTGADQEKAAGSAAHRCPNWPSSPATLAAISEIERT
jgi:hypothetical protein